jgi:hypothetical protein
MSRLFTQISEHLPQVTQAADEYDHGDYCEGGSGDKEVRHPKLIPGIHWPTL